MSLYDDIIAVFPELKNNDFEFSSEGSISLRNDSDGNGDYIEKWNYGKKLPPEFKIGK